MAKQITIPARGMRATIDHGPVQLKLVPAGNDQARVLFRVDYTRAPVPELSYFADYCDVQRKRSWVNIVFGKLAESEKELRTRVEIAFPVTFFNRQLWASSGPLRESVQKFVGESPISMPRIPESKEKIQTVRANNVFLVFQGEDSLLDFYYLSEKELFVARTLGETDASLQPVIRICTDSYLLHAFFQKCEPFVDPKEAEPAVTDATE